MRITTNYMLLASVLTAGALATACSEEKFQETPDRDEIYAREFIKEFGAPDPDHDWTMATTAGLRVNAPDPVSLQVYAEIDGKLYIFADIPGYKGENAVPVTIPKGTEELIVVADGKEYRCSPSATLDLTTAQPARGSRATHITVRDPNKKGGDFIITVDNSETSYVTFNLDENPAIKKILDDPYNSEYLRQGSDNHYWLGGPLMPNASNHYCPALSKAQSFNVYPLYINDHEGNTETPHVSLRLCMTDDKKAKDYDGTLHTLASSSGFGLYTSTNGSDWKRNCMPSSDNGTYVKSSCISIDIDVSHELYMSYEIDSQFSNNQSHSYSWFNYNTWGNNFYNAPIKDMNTCYCTTLFYKEVPVKWSVNGGNTVETEVAMYAMYLAPTSPADERPKKPDVFFMEHHGYGFVQWDQEFEEPKATFIYKWKLLAEDLGGSHDWDFNDLVIMFTDIITNYTPNAVPESFKPSEEDEGIYFDENGEGWEIAPYSQLYPKFTDPKLSDDMIVRKITVTPLASGGTLPIYLAWRGKISSSPFAFTPDMLLSEYINNHKSPGFQDGDFIIGCEMHKWLGGSSHHTPLNVGERKTHSGKDVTFYIPCNDYPEYAGQAPASSLGFFVLVDPNGTLGVDTTENFNPQSVNGTDKSGFTPVDIENWHSGYTVEMPRIDASSKVPQMFVLNNMRWPREGVNMGEAYPQFIQFVNDYHTPPIWAMGFNLDLIVKE